MRALRITLFLLFVLPLIFACSSKDKESYRFPLKVGNTWTMLQTMHYFDPAIQEMVTAIDTVYVEVAELIESPTGEPCYRVEFWSSDDPNQTVGYDILVNREDGLYQLGWKLGYNPGPFKDTKLHARSTAFGYGILDSQDKFDEVWLSTPKKILPYECEEGLSWSYGPNGNHLHTGYQIMPRERVTVPKGSYNCYVRKSNLLEVDDPVDVYDYYAKDGLIKHYYETTSIETDLHGNPIAQHPFTTKRELISRNLN